MLAERGEIAMALTVAAENHAPFPADVPDTSHNRDLFGQIQAETEALESAGIAPDVPAE